MAPLRMRAANGDAARFRLALLTLGCSTPSDSDSRDPFRPGPDPSHPTRAAARVDPVRTPPARPAAGAPGPRALPPGGGRLARRGPDSGPGSGAENGPGQNRSCRATDPSAGGSTTGFAGPHPTRPASSGLGHQAEGEARSRRSSRWLLNPSPFTGSILRRAREDPAVRCVRPGFGKGGCSYWRLSEAAIEGPERPDPAATDHTLHMRAVQSMQSMQSMSAPSDGRRRWAVPTDRGRSHRGRGRLGRVSWTSALLESGPCRKGARAPVLAGLEILKPSGELSKPQVDTFMCTEILAPRNEVILLFLVFAGSRHHRPGLYLKRPKSS